MKKGVVGTNYNSRLKPSIQDSGSKLLTQDSRSKLLTQDSGSKSLTQYSGSKPLTEDNELNHISNNAECKRSKHSLMKNCKRVENTFEFHTSCFCLNNKGDKDNNNYKNTLEKTFFNSKLFTINCEGTTDSEITNKFIFKDNTTLFAIKNRFSTCPTNQVTLNNNNQENESDEDLSSPPYYDERVSPPTSPVYPVSSPEYY
ncbi:hypothetical protein WA158_006929 [Blastocystis sp. Blastoise]